MRRLSRGVWRYPAGRTTSRVPLDTHAPLLEVRGLTVSYGPVRAVRSFDFSVGTGEVVAIVGPNGAGKSTTAWALMGLRRSEGSVVFSGRQVAGAPAELIARLGMTLVPEGRRVFAELSVAENLELGARAARKDRRDTSSVLSDIHNLFPVLAAREEQAAGTLSGGEQQQLAIARALMSRPSLLILDEPSLGVAPKLVDRLFELIGELRARGTTILLIDQNVGHVLRVSDRAYILVSGELRAEGLASDFDMSSLMTTFLSAGAET